MMIRSVKQFTNISADQAHDSNWEVTPARTHGQAAVSSARITSRCAAIWGAV